MRILIAFLSLISLSAFASQLPDYPFVTVTGLAMREVAPDKVTITFQVKTFDRLAERCYEQQSETASAIVAFSLGLGLPTESIVAQAIDKRVVNKEDQNGNELEIAGYEATRVVTVELQTLDPVSKLIEFLHRSANVEAISLEFGCKNQSEIDAALTEDACRKAKIQAERLAKGFGRKLGAVRAVSEVSLTDLENRFLRTRGEYSVASASNQSAVKKEFYLIPATVPFQKVVHAIFEIE